MVISHPLKDFAQQTVATMIRAKRAGPGAGAHTVNLGFELYTSENI